MNYERIFDDPSNFHHFSISAIQISNNSLQNAIKFIKIVSQLGDVFAKFHWIFGLFRRLLDCFFGERFQSIHQIDVFYIWLPRLIFSLTAFKGVNQCKWSLDRIWFNSLPFSPMLFSSVQKTPLRFNRIHFKQYRHRLDCGAIPRIWPFLVD